MSKDNKAWLLTAIDLCEEMEWMTCALEAVHAAMEHDDGFTAEHYLPALLGVLCQLIGRQRELRALIESAMTEATK